MRGPARRSWAVVAVVAGVLAVTAPMGTASETVPSGPMVWAQTAGTARYSYAPSVIHEGAIDRVWFCGGGAPVTGGDAIYYQEVNHATGVAVAPSREVFHTGPVQAGTWSAIHTCDPDVVRGTFSYPDPRTTPPTPHVFTYAMYYTSPRPCASPDCAGLDRNNAVGVAFSDDGLTWVDKKDAPVLTPQLGSTSEYGLGEAAVVNLDGHSNVLAFYSDFDAVEQTSRVYFRSSTDGINFGPAKAAPRAGTLQDVESPKGSMGNIGLAYDRTRGQLYMGTMYGDYAGAGHIAFYRMPYAEVMKGEGNTTARWQLVGIANADQTGSRINHTVGFARDGYGVMDADYPTLRAYFTMNAVGSPNSPAWDSIGDWRIGFMDLKVDDPLITLRRYADATGHWVTTMSRSPRPNMTLEGSWSLYQAKPTGVTTNAVQSCGNGVAHLDTIARDCPTGWQSWGVSGWIYATAQTGSTALYDCSVPPALDHWVAAAPGGCGAGKTAVLLGWAPTTAAYPLGDGTLAFPIEDTKLPTAAPGEGNPNNPVHMLENVDHTPVGVIDVFEAHANRVTYSGWTLDPDAVTSLHMSLFVDGKIITDPVRFTADVPRADIAAAYPKAGPKHGFSGWTDLPYVGSHRVCLAVWNWGGWGSHVNLGCLQVDLGLPTGSVDIARGVPGGVRVAGWAADPNRVDATSVHVYVDGVKKLEVPASLARPDVAAAYPNYPGWGPNHGYDATAAVAPGTHDVCVYAIDLDSNGVPVSNGTNPSTNVKLDCRTVVVGGPPVGTQDPATRSGNNVTINGWTIDPDVAAPVTIHVYVDGTKVTQTAASSSRPDLASLYPDYGTNHGFVVPLTVATGSHTICVYGIDVGPANNVLTNGTNTTLGCKTV